MGPPKMARSWWRGLTECGPLEKGMANHFSIFAWKTPWTEEPGRLQSWGCKVLDKYWSVLPRPIPGDLPPGIEPRSPALQTDALLSELLGKPSESCSVMSDSLTPQRLYSPWNSPGKNTGVGCHALLQGIFTTQGSNPGLPHCRWILYQLSH